MLLSELLGGITDTAVKDVEIKEVTSDSRAVRENTVFFAVKGGKQNGNDYIRDAVKNGASAVVTEYEDTGDIGVPCITAGNVRSALSVCAARLYAGEDACDTKFIAVTGTNGKTTVTHMIAHILSSCGKKCAVIGTLGCGIWGELSEADGMTTPPPERFYRQLGEYKRTGADFVIFEASSQGIAQERLSGLKCCGCKLKTAVFTNLSPEHMDYHRDMEDYFSVKRRLFLDFGAENSIINVSDEYGKRLFDETRGVSVNSVSVNGNAQNSAYRAENVKVSADGTEFELFTEDGIFSIHTPSVGAYTAENLVTAVSAAVSVGIEVSDAVLALESFSGVRGRMERVSDVPTVYIDFAHTPRALEAAIRTARNFGRGRKITALFGCGGDRDKTKRPMMGRLASELSDRVIITSDNCRGESRDEIIRDILSGVPLDRCYTAIPDRRDAIEFAVKHAEADEIILLLGKGHETYDDRCGVKHPFDEREIVKNIISNTP